MAVPILLSESDQRSAVQSGERMIMLASTVNTVRKTIEIDCPPGYPRPGDLIDAVVKGTPLEGLPEAHPTATTSRLFGCWKWTFPKVTDEAWREAQAVVKVRLRELHRKGVARYVSW